MYIWRKYWKCNYTWNLYVSYCLSHVKHICYVTEAIFVVYSFIFSGCTNIFYEISITFYLHYCSCTLIIKAPAISHLIRNLTFISYQMHYCKYCNYCIVANIPCGEKINFPYICLDPLLHMSCIYMWKNLQGV